MKSSICLNRHVFVMELWQSRFMKVKDFQAAGRYSQESVLNELRNKYRNTQGIYISVNAIMKLLQGLKPDKAALTE